MAWSSLPYRRSEQTARHWSQAEACHGLVVRREGGEQPAAGHQVPDLDHGDAGGEQEAAAGRDDAGLHQRPLLGLEARAAACPPVPSALSS
jgi:hypothetical protein